MRPDFTFVVVMFLVGFTTNIGLRYYGIQDDLMHIVLMTVLVACILKLIGWIKKCG